MPTKVCQNHGVHCWHLLSTEHLTYKVVYTRMCCWCGEEWKEEIEITPSAGWSYNTDAHPEHGIYAKPQIRMSNTHQGTDVPFEIPDEMMPPVYDIYGNKVSAREYINRAKHG